MHINTYYIALLCLNQKWLKLKGVISWSSQEDISENKQTNKSSNNNNKNTQFCSQCSSFTGLGEAEKLSFHSCWSNGRSERHGLLPRSLSAGWLFHALGIISLLVFKTNWLLMNLQMLEMLKVTWGWMMEKYSSIPNFWVRSPGTYFWIFTPACLTLSYPQRTHIISLGIRKQLPPPAFPEIWHLGFALRLTGEKEDQWRNKHNKTIFF